MRHLLIAVAFIGLVWNLAGKDVLPNTLNKRETSAGWKLLFDGKTLAGLEVHDGGDWKVEDGAFVCPGTSAGWLGTADSFADYDLKMEFRGGEQVNSGIFLRSSKEGKPHITGYELQIWDYQPGGYNTGSLVGHVKASPAKILADQWNNYEVKVEGDHFIAILNGKTILDGHDSTHTGSGVIGFQCNKNNANKIEFRSLKILPLGR
jgi:hypothetical protein